MSYSSAKGESIGKQESDPPPPDITSGYRIPLEKRMDPWVQ